MSADFKDIRIVALDEMASYGEPNSSLMHVVLKLSDQAPSEWSTYFNQAWTNHIYIDKHRASVSGDVLKVLCDPDDLRAIHLPELNKVIAETNEACRRYLADQQHKREAQAVKEAADRQKLLDVKRTLRFD